MKTVVTDWHIVSIIDHDKLLGKVLWGICVEDETCRFDTGDYICTSKIEEITPETKLIKTHSGSLYLLVGDGIKAEVQIKDFELLRHGFSPEQIAQLNLATSELFH